MFDCLSGNVGRVWYWQGRVWVANIVVAALMCFCIVEVHGGDSKLVIADYFAHHMSRVHDAHNGAWLFKGEAGGSEAWPRGFVYNADLIDEQGRHEIAGMAYPLLGLQSDMDRDYQEFQILLAKVAHIDGFALEWVHPDDASADAILRSMMAVAARYDFKLGVNWVESPFFEWLPDRREDVETRADVLGAYGEVVEYLLDEIYSSEVGLVVEGHPLILLFGGPNGPTPKEFGDVVNPILEKRGGAEPWFLKRGGGGLKDSDVVWRFNQWAAVLDGMFGWIGIHANHKPVETPVELQGKVDHYLVGEHMTLYLDRLRKINQRFVDDGKFEYRMQSVCPGFDNRGCAGWGNDLGYLERGDGGSYRRQWAQHVLHRDEIDAVLVATWNDFTEATVIEPTAEYGYREIASTQEFAAKFKGVSYNAAGLKLPERLFRLRKEQAWLERTGYEVSDAGVVLDRCGLLISGRDYGEASDLLDGVEGRFAELREQVVAESFSLVMGEGLREVGEGVGKVGDVFNVINEKPLLLGMDEGVAVKLRDRNFEGTMSFDYLDEGEGKVVVLGVPSNREVDERVRRHAKPWQVCEIYQTGSGQWKSGRVRVYKQRVALNHKGPFGFDFAVMANTQIRNVRMEFTTYQRTPE